MPDTATAPDWVLLLHVCVFLVISFGKFPHRSPDLNRLQAMVTARLWQSDVRI